MAAKKFKVGDTVVFNGYIEEVADEEKVLEDGESYRVVEVNDAEKSLAVEIDNPAFNPKKKETEDNSKTIMVDVFFDEVSIAEDDADEEDEAEEEAKPVAKRATKKPVAKKVAAKADEEDEEDADEEDEPVAKKAPAKKTTAKTTEKAPAKGRAKPVAKTTAKGKTKPAAKPAKAKEEKKEEDTLPALEHEDEDILKLVEDAEDILELAEELVEEGAALDYRLGGVLYHVRLSAAYHELDDRYKEPGGFGLYVKEKLNIEYRKAMYLIDIYYKFNLHGIDADKVQELGWTKASKIAAVMTDENAEELVELAETSTVADLSDSIKESYGKAGTDDREKVKRVTFKFRLQEDRATFVQEIIESVAKDMKFKDLGDAFEHIVAEWAAEHMNIKKARPASKAKTTAKTTSRRKVEEEEEVEA